MLIWEGFNKSELSMQSTVRPGVSKSTTATLRQAAGAFHNSSVVEYSLSSGFSQ